MKKKLFTKEFKKKLLHFGMKYYNAKREIIVRINHCDNCNQYKTKEGICWHCRIGELNEITK